MKKQAALLGAVGIALTAFLYTRPKFVVKDEAKKTTESPASSEEKVASDGNGETHTMAQLTKEQRSQLAVFQGELEKAQGGKRSETQRAIGQVYLQAMAFDSAAYYFEQIAATSNQVGDWELAGDTYFQAFGLALRNENIASLAKKVQLCYGKVLALKPTALQAKTNLAMTYVVSDSPMQAITTLRQVLEIEPNFEPALMNLGVLSMQSNQFDKAADRFRAVLRINPNNHNAQVGLAYSLIELKEKAQAKVLLEELLAHKDLEKTLRDEVLNTLQSLK